MLYSKTKKAGGYVSGWSRYLPSGSIGMRNRSQLRLPIWHLFRYLKRTRRSPYIAVNGMSELTTRGCASNLSEFNNCLGERGNPKASCYAAWDIWVISTQAQHGRINERQYWAAMDICAGTASDTDGSVQRLQYITLSTTMNIQSLRLKVIIW